MVCVESLSKWTEVIPLVSHDAKTIAEGLYLLVCRYGCFRFLLTDRGTEFTNSILRYRCQILGKKKVFSTSYRPQTQGVTERMNQTILQRLRTELQSAGSDKWLDKLLAHHFVCNESDSVRKIFFI